jgi:hypothetical protein
MKKLILFLSVLVLVVTSCSRNDDSGSQDSIIGTWTHHKLFINGVEESLTSCEMQETFTFSGNGTVSYKYYEVIQGNCELEESTSGSWTNEGNSIYKLTIEGESSSQELTFENNTFYFEFSDVINPLDPVFATYREVYIRN